MDLGPPALPVGAIATACVPAMAIPLGAFWLAAMLGLIMLFSPAVSVALNLTMMRTVPERLQGRVVAAMILLLSIAQPLGPLAAGLLLAYAGNRPTMLLLSGYLLLVTLIAALRRNFRNPGVDRAADAGGGGPLASARNPSAGSATG